MSCFSGGAVTGEVSADIVKLKENSRS